MPKTAAEKKWFQRLSENFVVDLTPLKISREFRLLFIGQAVSAFGSMMTYAVLPWQMYRLTKSSFAVGLLGVVEFVPMVTLAFIGGSLADAINRKKLIVSTEILTTLSVGALIVNATIDHPQVWPLFVIAAAFAALSALQRPAREAILPRLVPPEYMAAVAALGSIRFNFASIVGPAVGGVIAAGVGANIAYAVDACTFFVSLVTLFLMRSIPPVENADPLSLKSIRAGLHYAWSRKELLGTYAIDLNAMFFGMPMALFPAMAEYFGKASVGLFYAMPAVGALATSLTSGWAHRINKHGLAISIAASIWGLAIIGFGATNRLALALLFLIIAGAADMISGLFRMTMWNQTIPDHLRGRLAGIELISYSTGPMLGNAEAGLVASLYGIRASVISGGFLCVLGSVVLGFILPEFIRYDGREGLRRKKIEESRRASKTES